MAKKRTTTKRSKTTSASDFSEDSVLFNNLGLDFNINEKFEQTETQKQFIKLFLNPETKMLIVDGPAGTAKTYFAAFCALKLLSLRQTEQIIYIRSIVESASKSMGSLPGEVDDKFHPWAMPLLEKLDELLSKSTITNLLQQEFIKCLPVNFVRGLTFHNSIVIVDEAQNLTASELTTIITRFGNNTKFIIVGDALQSDINSKSGFLPIFKCFNDNLSKTNGIFTFKFNQKDIVRSQILQFIVEKLSKQRTK